MGITALRLTLQDRARRDGTDRNARQQRCEEEVILRADHNLHREAKKDHVVINVRYTATESQHRNTHHIVILRVQRVQ